MDCAHGRGDGPRRHDHRLLRRRPGRDVERPGRSGGPSRVGLPRGAANDRNAAGRAGEWADVLADDLRLGIGVHTGVAQVGNAGSSRRWKYGPRGANVHLASRVEAATKEVGMPVVVTRATASRLSNRLLSYRLCRAQMPGINEPVELYGIRPATTEPKLLAALGRLPAGAGAVRTGSTRRGRANRWRRSTCRPARFRRHFLRLTSSSC